MKEHMRITNKRTMQILMLALLCASAVWIGARGVHAANHTISVNPNDEQNVSIYVGDTGQIVPNTSAMTASTVLTGYDEYGNAIYESDPNTLPTSFTYTLRDSYWEDIASLSLNADGTFQATTPGECTVRVVGVNGYGFTVFTASISFIVSVDMTNVTLAKTSVKAYLFPEYYYDGDAYYSGTQITIPVNSAVVLSDSMDGVDVSAAARSKKVSVSASLDQNVLTLQLNAQKKRDTKVTVTIAGKSYTIQVSLRTVGISAQSALIVKGQTKKLKITGYKGVIQWSSTNPKAVSVDKKGTLHAKQIGNAVITAKIGDNRLGCAVSVTTSSIKKVCARGTYMGTHWKYSQAKRTQSGYYDCSALVWKAYRKYTSITFGSAGYPGTTVTESAWCKAHGKMIKGGYTYTKMEKMKLNPGDIVFKSTDLSKPYSTTYHVEMFTGYTCQGYDSDGKPIVQPLWAARGAGYGAEDGSLLARPTK